MYNKISVIFYAACLISLKISGGAEVPNFVIILTDDQDVVLDGLTPMTKTLEVIANEGATFQNAFVNSPICCPSRSSLLTGKYLHNIHVRNNSLSGNCSSAEFQIHHEPLNFINILKKQKNYITFYAGKYLNQYGTAEEAGGLKHVPPGFDWWVGLKGNSKYYNYELSINGSKKTFTNEYFTDLIKDYALNFLNQQQIKETPFLVFVAPPAAHAPFTPAPRHSNSFPNVKAKRTPTFNATPTDKHWLLQQEPIHFPDDVSILDDIQRHRMQSLLAVDEMVDEIMRKLKENNVLEKTYVIFTSDNGFHIGQFGQPWDKRQPYETDIRVPFLIRGPFINKKILIQQPISLVDLAPTLLDISGIDYNDMDGTSFKDVLVNQKVTEPRVMLVEYFGEGNDDTVDKNCDFIDPENLSECSKMSWCKCQDARNNTYTCLRYMSLGLDDKYCQFEDNKKFVELYDLIKDPNEFENKIKTNRRLVEKYNLLLKKMRRCKGKECRNLEI